MRSLKYFWKDGRNKAQKSSTSASPSSKEEEPSIQEVEVESTTDNVEEEPSIQLPNNIEEPQPQINAEERTHNVDLLPHDPGKRIPILGYPTDDQDAVRRGYIAKKRCVPRSHDFPQREIGGMRRFNTTWFDKYDWLEYSVEKDAAFCFVCYLFKDKTTSFGTHDAFVNGGFRGWNKTERFDVHVGCLGSIHNQSKERFDFFIKPKTSIIEAFSTYTTEAKLLYKSRLTFSLRCLRYLLGQGLACRGHDENEESSNRGNFLELLTWLGENNDNVQKVVLKNAPRNNMMIAPTIQQDLINSCAKETTRLILEELGDEHFGILADESSDVAQKEQMALCLRFVNKKGRVCERFLGIVHVEDTTSLSLKNAIESLLMENSLSMSRIRGQGYDGASNMRGEINGLKTLIMDENKAAYYIHCFAHQLQLTLVAVAKENYDCIWLFEHLGFLLNVIGISCKRKEMLRNIQALKVMEALESNEIESGQGLNQELGLGRPGDTRWGSHYKTVLNIISLYGTITSLLETIGKGTIHRDDRVKAQTVMTTFESFEFIFMVHLMCEIFGFTDKLCQALQRREQDIVNAMAFVSMTKEQLQKLRDDGWEDFIQRITCFCVKHKVEVPNMDGDYVPRGRSKRYFQKVSNLHRFRVEMFISVIDLQLQELNNRFDEVNMELLTCMACLSPINSFASFDKEKLLRLAEFYEKDFTDNDFIRLRIELQFFVNDMRKDERFREVKDLSHLSLKLVETNKHVSYKLVYLLLKLVLILPVATTSVERVFSSMTYVKNKLRNKMGDQLLNDSLITFIEKDHFFEVSDDDVINRFQNMKTRRVLL